MKIKRLDKYDNLRGLGIFLIVLMHLDLLHIFTGFPKNLLFATHLPLLYYVSGYFSKIGPDESIKSFKRILIPYLVFCIIVKIAQWFVLGYKLSFKLIFVEPSACLWFLIALFIMKMMLPIFNRFKYPILASIICALVMGFIHIDHTILGLTRCFAYFPIFLVGFYHKQTKNNITTQYRKIVNLFNKHYKIISIVIVILFAIVCYKFQLRIFMFKKPYSGNLVYELIKRIIVIGLEIGIVLVLDKFMTNRNCFLTKFGKNSMAIYLLHIYPMICLKKILPQSLAGNIAVSLIITFGLAFIITYILSRDVVSKYLNKFTDGIYNIIAKPI